MKGRVVVGSLMFLVFLGLAYGRLRNAMIGEITSSDHPILRTLNSHRAISSKDEVFRGVDEVCIVNKIDINEPGSRNCKTSGEVLALVKGGSCDIIPLEKLQVRVLFSENTFECRKANVAFRVVIHQDDDSEFLVFD